MTEEIDPLEGGQELKDQTISFGVLKDFIKGTITRKKKDVTTEYGIKDMTEIKGQFGSYHQLKKIKQGVFEPIEPPIEVQPGSYHILWSGKNRDIDDLIARSQIGDLIGIRFEGEGEGRKGTYKKYLTKNYGRDKEWMGEDSETTEEVSVEEGE